MISIFINTSLHTFKRTTEIIGLCDGGDIIDILKQERKKIIKTVEYCFFIKVVNSPNFFSGYTRNI